MGAGRIVINSSKPKTGWKANVVNMTVNPDQLSGFEHRHVVYTVPVMV